MTDFQHKRGTSADHDSYIGEPGEITINTETNRPHIHDGVTSGGHPLALESDLGGGGTGDYAALVTDFEGDLSAWSGDTGGFSLVSSPVKNGTQALEGGGNSSGIASTGGLNTYPSDGSTHRVHIHLGGADVRSLWTFFAQSEVKNPDGYEVFFDADSTVLELRRRSSGSPSTLDSTSVTYPTGEYLYADIAPDVGGADTIDITLYDATDSELASINHDTSGDSTTYTSGGVATLSNSDTGTTPSRLDYIGVV